MSRSERPSILSALNGLGWPLIVGLAAASLFYLMLLEGPLDSPVLHRYFAEHPVSYCATIMFCVGLAALGIKFLDVLSQYASLEKTQAALKIESPQISECEVYLEQYKSLSKQAKSSYLASRMHDAIQFLQRKGNPAGLDDELKYLADMDAAKQQEGYSLVRIITWATPMLGFLGTVIGITHALGDLGSQSELLATDPKAAMQALLGGLYVAFDTTALALTLSIILMFVQFVVDRAETQLLLNVDQRVSQELTGRFEVEEVQTDPHLAIVQRMSTAVVNTIEQLVKQQTAHWQESIEQANESWRETLAESRGELQAQLSGSIEVALDKFSTDLSQAGEEAESRLQDRWEHWQSALAKNAEVLQSQQADMTRQSEIMTRAIEATGEVIKLEDALNRNLNALAGAHNFEDTVMSLSAAIHLLSTRLGQPAAVQLEQRESDTIDTPEDRAA